MPAGSILGIQNLAQLLPICKKDALQPSVHIEPKRIGFLMANMSVFDSIGNFVRLACHIFRCTQGDGSDVFDLDHVAEAGAHAEDKNLRGFEEEASSLLTKSLAWIVVPEAGLMNLTSSRPYSMDFKKVAAADVDRGTCQMSQFAKAAPSS